MPTFKNKSTGARHNVTGKAAAYYRRASKTYSEDGTADIDRFAGQQEYVESGQAAEDAKNRKSKS